MTEYLVEVAVFALSVFSIGVIFERVQEYFRVRKQMRLPLSPVKEKHEERDDTHALVGTGTR